MAETLGFIGLGNMGQAIASNLLAAGYGLRVYNRTASKTAPLAGKGVYVAKSAAEVASPGGIVLTMVADDHALEQVCLAHGSFVEKLGPGGIHTSLSTIAPATARRLSEHHAKHNVQYVASPVFGRPEAAAAKKLWIATSGPAAAKKRSQPIFDAIGQGVVEFGEDPGAANVVKLCGNLLIFATIDALAEAMVLAEKSGIGMKSLAEIVGKFSPLHASYANIIAEQKFEPAGFPVLLGLKDINLVLRTAAESATPLPLASLLHDHLLSAVAKKRENLDWSAVALGIAEDAGLKPSLQSKVAG
jgi:3-hydroxyisobutyrate dehydrogenase-like beta-hydroxyacid dehydrogenase